MKEPASFGAGPAFLPLIFSDHNAKLHRPPDRLIMLIAIMIIEDDIDA
jgi:hypothetical protein